MSSQPGDWFDEKAANNAAEFFPRYLRHHKGKWAGKPFVLEPWQRDEIIRPLFGWKRADGTRRYRTCDVWVPRKNGKTQLAAGVALLMLVGDGEQGAEGYAIASKEEQARIVFSAAQAMAGHSEVLSKHLEVWRHKIYCPALNGSFRPLTGKPEGKHGLSPSFKIGDELHEWPDDRLDQYVRQGMAARDNPLEFHTSTAGMRKGHGWEVYQYDRKLRDGIIDDPDRLVVIYEAGADDDWQDPAIWAKANPNLGVSVNMSYMEAEAKKAAENPRHENDFKRYHLNIWTEQDVRWLPMDRWARCTAQPQNEYYWRDLEDELIGRPCFGGIDLSATIDITAIVWCFPPTSSDRRLIWLPRFFVPEDSVLARVRRDRVPYDKWAAQGALELTPGNVVDYEAVLRRTVADSSRFDVRGVGIDRWNDSWISPQLTEHFGEDRFKRFPQTSYALSPPTKELERQVIAGTFEHGNHPVLRWMASNVAVDMNSAGDIKPVKNKSSEKIDGIVAGLIGLGMAMPDRGPLVSVYEERGLLFV